MDYISRWKWHLAGGLVALGLVFPWPILSENMRLEIEQNLQQALGGKAHINGSILVSLLPRPYMQISDLQLKDQDHKFALSAQSLNGTLGLLPLFGGRLEIADLAVDQAHLTLDLDGFTPAAAGIHSSPTQALQQIAPRQIAFDNLNVTIFAANRPRLALDHLNGILDWRGLEEAMDLQARGTWQNAAASVSLKMDSPNNLLNGLTSPITAELSSTKLTATFKGDTAFGSNPKIDGRLTLSASALRDILTTYDLAPGLPGALQKFSLTSQIRSNDQTLSFEQVSLKADGNIYEGTLALTKREGRPLLSGTLATDQLSLAPMLADLPPLMTPSGTWSLDELPDFDKRDLDLDLRLSASQTRLQKLQFKNAGMAIKASNGQMDFSLFDALSSNGHIKGRLTAARQTDGLQLRLSANVQDLDSSKFLGDLLRSNPLLGTLNGQINLDGTGRDIAGLMQALTGTLDFEIDNGDVIGIDLDQALRRSEKRPLSVPLEIRRGRTSFTKAKISAHFENGFLLLDEAQASGFNLASTLEGRLSFLDRNYALRLSSLQTAQDGTPKPDAQRLLLDLSGPWEAPRFDFDFEGLIRRSEAAAPLLSLKPAKGR